MIDPNPKQSTPDYAHPKKHAKKTVVEGDFLDIIKVAGKARKIKKKRSK